MPLDRQHVTAGMRVMIPLYMFFFGVIGISFMASPYHLLVATPMLRYADTIMSIRAWGGVFLACGLLMLAAIVTHNRGLYRYALLVCCISMTVWMLVAIAGIFAEPVTYSAWAWPGIVAGACYAANRSLGRDAAQPPRRREH